MEINNISDKNNLHDNKTNKDLVFANSFHSYFLLQAILTLEVTSKQLNTFVLGEEKMV